MQLCRHTTHTHASAHKTNVPVSLYTNSTITFCAQLKNDRLMATQLSDRANAVVGRECALLMAELIIIGWNNKLLNMPSVGHKAQACKCDTTFGNCWISQKTKTAINSRAVYETAFDVAASARRCSQCCTTSALVKASQTASRIL